MLKFALLFVCIAVIEGRNLHRFIREESTNATDPDLKNATASANDAPDVTELQADLVAPASGPKPLEAKYTIRVRPKLKDGVPQIQEIRIMPPKSKETKGYVKPLMVLKQNITKPLIENIEIDVPEKGVKFASKPSVEVVEGGHREMMQVTKGQVMVENNAAQKSDTNSEDKEVKPQDEATSQNSTAPSSSQNATETAPSQNAAETSASQDKAAEPSTSQDTTQASASQDATKPSTSQNTTEASPSQDKAEPSTSKNGTEPSTSQNPAAASPSQDKAEPSTSQNATDAASSQKPPQQSQDAAEKNPATSTQSQAAPQKSEAAAVAAPQKAETAVTASQKAEAAAAAPQNTANTAQAAPLAQPSAQAAPVAPVYSQPANPAPAPAAQPAAYTSVSQTCTDNVMCRIYPDDRCRETWLMTNCALKCKLCSK